MSRYIDADALYETLCRLWDKSDSEDFEKGVFRIVINAPSIDIVRCEGCKYCKEKGLSDCPSGYGCLYCTHKQSIVHEDDYCSWGEKR